MCPSTLRAVRRLRPILPKRYVVVHGFYGAGNVGDEAILAATLDEVRRVTDLEPYVFAWDARRVREEFGVRSLNPNRVRNARLAHVLLRSRAYLLGGGGLLKDYGGSSASLERWLRWPELAGRLKIKTMLWSVGVENVLFEASRGRICEVLSNVDVVTVRDEGSRARLREIGVARPVEVTADPVPHLAAPYRRRRPRTRSGPLRVAVCLRHWYTSHNAVADEAAFERLLTALAGGLDDICKRHGGEVTFIPFRTAPGDDDRLVSRSVAERMRSGRFRLVDGDYPTVDETLYEVARADLVVSMRLHGAVMATSMGIPTLSIAYMPKVADYMESIGQKSFCAAVPDVSADWLSARAGAALADEESLASQLRDSAEILSGRFLRNGALLADLLEKPEVA